MKKTMHFLLVAVALVFGMTSCNELNSMMDNPVSSYLELKTTSVSIVPGGTYQIEATSISTAKITYESSNPDVAIVDPSGKVTALEDGEATITVRVEANDTYQAGATQFQVKVQSPLTLEAKADGKINVRYINGITLDEPIVYTIFTKEGLKNTVSITETTAIEVDKGDKVQFMSKNDHLGTGSSYYVNIKPEMECAVYGNVMSLITPEGDFNTNKTIKKPYAFCRLFYLNVLSSTYDTEAQKWIYKYAIVNHDKYKLVLPATTLSDHCYYYMFGYTGLTEAPELPATTLAQSCYSNLFNNCKNLTVAPKLPATNLASGCYQSMFANSGITEAPELKVEDLSNSNGCYYRMFYGCAELTKAPKLPATKLSSQCYQSMFASTGLTEAPELPATTLANYCYAYLFNDCKNLTVAPKLPATKLAPWCYQGMFSYSAITEAPELKVEDLSNSNGCYSSMFEGCTELTKAPELPAKKLSSQCYQNMFYGCSKLEVAPVLPAAELASECYSYMFMYCSKLKSLTCLATSMTNTNATENWLQGAGANVEGECTFTKAASATWYYTAGQWDETSGWNVTNLWTIKDAE